jgi:hypothetical protein
VRNALSETFEGALGIDHLGDSSAGPSYLASRERIEEFFNLDESLALQLISESPVLERAMYETWKRVYAVAEIVGGNK